MVSDGFNVSLNSDDPPMFSTSIVREWEIAVTQFGFDVETAKRLTSNAVEAALLPEADREALRLAVGRGVAPCGA